MYRLIIALLFFFVCTNAEAQLCQGSLGDPIINITFGSGSNPGPSLSAATTNYQYVSNDCPSDGFYTVRNNTTGCFGSSWHNLSSDHTGNPGGYFMLVNASLQPSAFYVDTVKGLCGGTTYEFAAWVINVLLPSACSGSGITPDLTFRIELTDGTLLQSYNTNSIASVSSPTWKQYGFFFTTPAGSSDIVLRIINNSQGGCGNDLALDDITFRPCGPMLTPSIVGLPATTASFCEGSGQSYTFSCMVSGGFNNPSFQWQQNLNNGGWTDIPGATTTTLPVNFPAGTPVGTYLYRLSVAEGGNINSLQCRVASAAVTINVNARPVTSCTSNSPVCEKQVITLTATGGTQYSWTGPAGFNATGNPVSIFPASLTHAGKYYVTVTNAAGCQKKDSAMVVVHAAPTAQTLFSDSSICESSTIQLGGVGIGAVAWLPSTGLSSTTIPAPFATPANTTTYLFIVTNTDGCKDTAYTTVNVIQPPVADAGPDRTMIAGNRIQLNGSVQGNAGSYYWTPPVNIDNPGSLHPFVNPTSNSTYVLHAEAVKGCGTVTDTMHIKVYQALYIPNAFTPNGDGINDTWNIPALEAYTQHELYVLDRYGEIVFTSKGQNRKWDGRFKGKDLPSGAYTYFIDLKQGFGTLKGSVLIIR
jgi:gliding motility-associated-like protein